jgi:DNA-binding transcriptional LysR family regulator
MLKPAHLSRIDLNLLVLFQVVLEERHVGRAAAQLNLTPSAVSHALGRLRTLLNDPLFLRTPKGVVPTARALELRKPVEDILARVHGVIGIAAPFDQTTTERRFVVAAPDAVLASTAGPLLDRISVIAPGVDIGLVHVMPRRLVGSTGTPWSDCLNMLESRDIDLALLPLKQIPPRFESRRLYDEDFVVAMRKGHPFARAPSEAAFCAARHLLVSLAGDPVGFIDEMLAKRGGRRRVALTVPSFVMALMQLSDSDFLSVLPRRLVAHHAKRLGLIATELPFKRTSDPIRAVVTKAALMDAGVAWLLALLAELHAPHRQRGRGGAP